MKSGILKLVLAGVAQSREVALRKGVFAICVSSMLGLGLSATAQEGAITNELRETAHIVGDSLLLRRG
jgi:hypothetical protein